MSDLQKYKKKQLQDAEFKAEYERTRPEFEIMRALVDARISQHMTQKELAEKSGCVSPTSAELKTEHAVRLLPPWRHWRTGWGKS